MPSQTATTFEPVEFYNATYPNQKLVDRSVDREDHAADPTVNFLAGYFLASQPWQVELIERACVDSSGIPYAHKADGVEQECPTCGWPSKSSRAFVHHIAQHS